MLGEHLLLVILYHGFTINNEQDNQNWSVNVVFWVTSKLCRFSIYIACSNLLVD